MTPHGNAAATVAGNRPVTPSTSPAATSVPAGTSRAGTVMGAQAALTLREIAAHHGYSLGTVRTWSLKAPDWPPAVGARREPAARNVAAYEYDADRIAAWIRTHGRQRPDGDQWTLHRIAAELGVPVENIRGHRRNGTLPRPAGYWRGRPRWNPDDIHNWDVGRRLPVDAWTMTDIAAYTGRRNPLTRSGAPQPDGHTGRTRWWRPSTITTWWSPIAAEQAVQAEQRQRSTTAVPEARWFGRDVAAATGMSYETVRTYRRLGKLPSPDGTTGAGGRGRPWWRPETILSWDRPSTTGRPRGQPRQTR